MVDILYARPIATGTLLASRLGLSQPTIDRLLLDLQQLGIMAEMTGQRRNRVFYFKEYYHLFTA